MRRATPIKARFSSLTRRSERALRCAGELRSPAFNRCFPHFFFCQELLFDTLTSFPRTGIVFAPDVLHSDTGPYDSAVQGRVGFKIAPDEHKPPQRMENSLATALIASEAAVSTAALVVAFRATRLAREAKTLPAEIRELIREMEDVLEKLASRQARESMRVLRKVRKGAEVQEEPEPEQGGEPAALPGDFKSQLWQLARSRGMAR